MYRFILCLICSFSVIGAYEAIIGNMSHRMLHIQYSADGDWDHIFIAPGQEKTILSEGALQYMRVIKLPDYDWLKSSYKKLKRYIYDKEYQEHIISDLQQYCPQKHRLRITVYAKGHEMWHRIACEQEGYHLSEEFFADPEQLIQEHGYYSTRTRLSPSTILDWGVARDSGAQGHQEDRYDVSSLKGPSVYAVYDGHGGTLMSEALSYGTDQVQRFADYLRSSIVHAKQSDDIAQTCNQWQQGLIQEQKRQILSEGSTACCLYCDPSQDKALFLNLGDSRGVQLKQDGTIQTTIDHTPRRDLFYILNQPGGTVVLGGAGVKPLWIYKYRGKYHISSRRDCSPELGDVMHDDETASLLERALLHYPLILYRDSHVIYSLVKHQSELYVCRHEKNHNGYKSKQQFLDEIIYPLWTRNLTWRVSAPGWYGGIMPSRAFGDYVCAWYDPEYAYVRPSQLPGISMIPGVQHTAPPSQTTAYILATDGIWDVLSTPYVAQILKQERDKKHTAQQAAQRIVRAAGKGTGDNKTALVVFPERSS